MPPLQTPKTVMTPTKEIPNPNTRRPLGFSLAIISGAIITVKSGVAAFKIPAREEETRCSPKQ
jgi:hypothetical protein